MLRELVPRINMTGDMRGHVAGTSPRDKYDAETSL